MSKFGRRTPPEPPPQLADDPDFEDLGPEIKALNPRRRMFVWYFANNGGDGAAAYRLAYPACESDGAARVGASKLRARADIRAALASLGKFQFNGLTLPAIEALRTILDNPSHKQYAKVALEVLDRTGFLPEQMVTHKHEHVHRLDSKQVDQRLMELSVKLLEGLPRDVAVPVPALPPPIEAEFVEVEPVPAEPKDDDEEIPTEW